MGAKREVELSGARAVQVHSVLAYLVMKLNQGLTMAGCPAGCVDMEIILGNHRIQTSSFPLASVPVDNGLFATIGYQELTSFSLSASPPPLPFFFSERGGVGGMGVRQGMVLRSNSGCVGSLRFALLSLSLPLPLPPPPVSLRPLSLPLFLSFSTSFLISYPHPRPQKCVRTSARTCSFIS